MNIAIWSIWVVGAAVVLVGLLVGVRALCVDPGRRTRRCPKCWYDMSATGGRRCPECGREYPKERSFYKRRRRWGRAFVGLFAGAAGFLMFLSPVVFGPGLSVVPTPVLNFVLSFQDEKSLIEHYMSLQRGGAPTEWERLLGARCARVEIERCLRLGIVPGSPIGHDRGAWYYFDLLGAEARIAAPPTRRMYARGSAEQRAWAVSAIGWFVVNDMGGEGLLKRAIREDESPAVRYAAVRSLINSGPDPDELTRMIKIALAKETDQDVCDAMVDTLLQFDPSVGELEALLAAVRSTNVGYWYRFALVRRVIEHDATDLRSDVGWLGWLLDDEHRANRAWAVDQLRFLGADGAPCLAKLDALAERDVESVRELATLAAAEIRAAMGEE